MTGLNKLNIQPLFGVKEDNLYQRFATFRFKDSDERQCHLNVKPKNGRSEAQGIFFKVVCPDLSQEKEIQIDFQPPKVHNKRKSNIITKTSGHREYIVRKMVGSKLTSMKDTNACITNDLHSRTSFTFFLSGSVHFMLDSRNDMKNTCALSGNTRNLAKKDVCRKTRKESISIS